MSKDYEKIKKREKDISCFEEFKSYILEEDSYIDFKTVLKYVPMVIPKEPKEYSSRYSLWSSNSTDWLRYIRELKTTNPNLSKDEVWEKIAEWFYEYLMNRERDSVQTTKLVNKKNELVCEIHVILSKSGYTVMPYFNEGRKITVDEKINNHIEVLLEKAPSVLADIQEHFKKEHLEKVVLARGGNLRRSKPKDNKKMTFDELDYYIWRMTAFNTGVNVHLPVMASFEIRTYFKQKFKLEVSYFGSNEDSIFKNALNLVDLLTDQMSYLLFGEQASAGAKIWANALGIQF